MSRHDEISMLITSFFGLQQIKKNLSKMYLIPIVVLYYYFHSYFFYFLVVFAGSQLYLTYKSLKLIRQRNFGLKKKIMLVLYINCFALGLICWLADQLYCEEFKHLYMHAWWHFFTALSAFFGFMGFSNLSF